LGPIVAVFVGGILGTALRLGLDDLIVSPPTAFPLATLIINIVGSLALGILIARVWPTASNWVRAGLGPGVLGGFTTFSAVMVSMVTLGAGGKVMLAIVYLVLTIVLGFGAAALGLRIGRRPRVVPIIEVDE
jgi:fluoride exporter